ncbi:DUF1304 domain-containing protein [Streptococcus entericus]|uniref:DUF1304 domain-containing protein n=1 Tax=Streptococcus entericus TaxID=155680 RepID=UPI00037F7997|nr:DUF1304 family protein [Streptococcus entericus]
MHPITIILASLVALEHVYIFYLESLVPQSHRTAKVFDLSKANQANPIVITLFKNQGIYNLGLALAMIYSLITSNQEMITLFAVFVTGVATYGAVTSSPKILLTQGGPAILTLLSLLILD